MPTCCDCGKDAPKSGFAKSQLKKPPEKRRCKECAKPLANDDAAVQHASIGNETNARRPTNNNCWVCLCDDDDDHGPPRRDCSCRGTAGYVHVSCLVDMASQKADSMNVEMSNSTMMGLGVSVGGNVVNPWRECMTCHQVYRGDTIYHLAKAMETKYDAAPNAPKFWKNAAYDNLCGVLAERGDFPGALKVLQKRLNLVKNQYRYELRSGTKRSEIHVTKDLVNILVNTAGMLISTPLQQTVSPEHVECILDEAERYADQKQSKDGGYLCATVMRQRAMLEKEKGNYDEAFRLMQKAVSTLDADPSFRSSFNGIRTHWDYANIMIMADEGSGMWKAYEHQEETLSIARRVLGADHPFVLEKEAELKAFKERMGEEWFGFARAFQGGAGVDKCQDDKVLATGFCYTGQRVKIVGVTEDGYRALLSEEDGSWGVSYVPFPAVCLDEGTRVVLQEYHEYRTKLKGLKGRCGVVKGFEFLNNEMRNFDALRLQVDVDGVENQMLVKPGNAMVRS